MKIWGLSFTLAAALLVMQGQAQRRGSWRYRSTQGSVLLGEEEDEEPSTSKTRRIISHRQPSQMDRTTILHSEERDTSETFQPDVKNAYSRTNRQRENSNAYSTNFRPHSKMHTTSQISNHQTNTETILNDFESDFKKSSSRRSRGRSTFLERNPSTDSNIATIPNNSFQRSNIDYVDDSNNQEPQKITSRAERKNLLPATSIFPEDVTVKIKSRSRPKVNVIDSNINTDRHKSSQRTATSSSDRASRYLASVTPARVLSPELENVGLANRDLKTPHFFLPNENTDVELTAQDAEAKTFDRRRPNENGKLNSFLTASVLEKEFEEFPNGDETHLNKVPSLSSSNSRSQNKRINNQYSSINSPPSVTSEESPTKPTVSSRRGRGRYESQFPSRSSSSLRDSSKAKLTEPSKIDSISFPSRGRPVLNQKIDGSLRSRSNSGLQPTFDQSRSSDTITDHHRKEATDQPRTRIRGRHQDLVPLSNSGVQQEYSSIAKNLSEEERHLPKPAEPIESSSKPSRRRGNTRLNSGNKNEDKKPGIGKEDEEVSDDDNYPDVYKQLKKAGNGPREILALLKARKKQREALEAQKNHQSVETSTPNGRSFPDLRTEEDSLSPSIESPLHHKDNHHKENGNTDEEGFEKEKPLRSSYRQRRVLNQNQNKENFQVNKINDRKRLRSSLQSKSKDEKPTDASYLPNENKKYPARTVDIHTKKSSEIETKLETERPVKKNKSLYKTLHNLGLDPETLETTEEVTERERFIPSSKRTKPYGTSTEGIQEDKQSSSTFKPRYQLYEAKNRKKLLEKRLNSNKEKSTTSTSQGDTSLLENSSGEEESKDLKLTSSSRPTYATPRKPVLLSRPPSRYSGRLRSKHSSVYRSPLNEALLESQSKDQEPVTVQFFEVENKAAPLESASLVTEASLPSTPMTPEYTTTSPTDSTSPTSGTTISSSTEATESPPLDNFVIDDDLDNAPTFPDVASSSTVVYVPTLSSSTTIKTSTTTFRVVTTVKPNPTLVSPIQAMKSITSTSLPLKTNLTSTTLGPKITPKQTTTLKPTVTTPMAKVKSTKKPVTPSPASARVDNASLKQVLSETAQKLTNLSSPITTQKSVTTKRTPTVTTKIPTTTTTTKPPTKAPVISTTIKSNTNNAIPVTSELSQLESSSLSTTTVEVSSSTTDQTTISEISKFTTVPEKTSTTTQSSFGISEKRTEAPLSQSSADFVAYALLPNNTLVRRISPRSTTAPTEIPFFVYGLYPNGTIVKKYPNGTVVPDDPLPDTNELVGEVDPLNKQGLSDILERDRSFAFPHSSTPPAGSMASTPISSSEATSPTTPIFLLTSPNTETPTSTPTTVTTVVSTKLLEMEEALPSTAVTSPEMSTTSVVESSTLFSKSNLATTQKLTTSTIKPAVMTTTTPKPTLTTTTPPKAKPVATMATKTFTTRTNNPVPRMNTSTTATTKKSITPVNVTTKQPATTVTITTRKPETTVGVTTSIPLPSVTVSTKKPETTVSATTKKTETTTIATTIKTEKAERVTSKKPVSTITTTKKPETTVSIAMKKTQTTTATSTTTTVKSTTDAFSTTPTPSTVAIPVTSFSTAKEENIVQSPTPASPTSGISENIALLDNLLRLQGENNVIGDSLGSVEASASQNSSPIGPDDDDLANRIIQLAIERAQTSTESSITAEDLDLQQLSSSPEPSFEREGKSLSPLPPDSNAVETSSPGGKISLWVVPSSERDTEHTTRAQKLSPEEEQVLTALLAAPQPTNAISLRDQLLLAELLAAGKNNANGEGVVVSSTNRPRKKKKRPTSTTPPPPLSPLAALFGGSGGRGLLNSGGSPANEDGEEGGDYTRPQGGLLVNAAINITRAVSQFMGLVLQGAAQSFQSFLASRTQNFAQYLGRGGGIS